MEKAGRMSEEGGKCLGKVKQGKLSWETGQEGSGGLGISEESPDLQGGAKSSSRHSIL